ncbi:MAG: hypothetical protein RIB65_17515 [Ilumatobacter fluminis]|uniref:COG1470 family protein n=1 Tax=Ilumatobacter fluminis TaxID=467091 RepID=UPI0032EAC662
MGASAAFDRPTLPVEPGASAEVRLRVRNTGDVVDSFTFESVGIAPNWVTFEPVEIRLFPETEEFVTVRVSPPRASDTPLGELTFAVRVISAEDPDGSVAEELTLVIGDFGQRFGELHPKTSTGRTKGVHELAVDNFGNTEITPSFEGIQPDGLLTVEIKPPSVEVAPGTAALATVTVRPRKRFWRGQPKSIPFQVVVQEGEDEPQLIDANFLQQPMVPKWFWKALLALLALLILLFLLWKLLLEPSVESTARDSAEEVVDEKIAEAVDPIEQRLDEAGIPEAGAGDGGGGGGGGGGGETTAPTTAPPTTAPPVVVPVTTAPPGPTTSPAPGETTTTTSTTIAPITETGPFDFRIEVFDQPGGAGTNSSQNVTAGTKLEVTDIVFQNPTGASGEIIVSRSGSPLFTVNMANFRDLDYHFVAPFVFDAGESIDVQVVCATAGTIEPRRDEPSPGACRAAVLFAGYSTTTS